MKTAFHAVRVCCRKFSTPILKAGSAAIWIWMITAGVYGQEKLHVYQVDLLSGGQNFAGELLQPAGKSVPASQHTVTFRLKGVLSFRRIGRKNDTLIFGAGFRVEKYEISGAAASGFTDTSGVSLPFYFSWHHGIVEQIWISRNAAPAVSSNFRMLLSYLQFPAGHSGKFPLEILQDDPIGHCLVKYSLLNSSTSADTLFLQKKSYVRSGDEWDDNALKTVYSPSAHLILAVSNGHYFPLRIEGTDTVTTRLSGKIIGRSHTLLSISVIGADTVNSADDVRLMQDWNEAAYQPVHIYTYQQPGSFRKTIRAQILGDDRLPGLITRLQQWNPGEDADSLALKLKSLATVFPETAYPIAAILDTAAPGGVTYQLLSDALLDAETSQSLNAIAVLLWKHRDQWTYCKKMITGMGLAARVTDTAVGIFQRLAMYKPMTAISKTAWLALGAMNDHLSKLDSIKGTRLWWWIRDSLQTLNTQDYGIRMKLLVWGNSNQYAAYDSVISYIHSNNGEWRTLAVVAAGQITHPGKISLLLNVLQSDTLDIIRTSAARGLSGLLNDTVHLNVWVRLLRNERDSFIRVLLLNAVDIATLQKKMIRSELEKVKQSDQSWSVRAAAGDLLRRMYESE